MASRDANRGWRMPTNARWYHLYMENEDFKLWFDNLARGSPTTAVEYAQADLIIQVIWETNLFSLDIAW